MAYTEAQITELKAIVGLDHAKATSFAEKHGLTARSVIAKAKALDIPYISKFGTKPAKKAAVRRKSDIATSINELLDVNLTSLDKLTLADLEVLEERIKELTGAE